MSLHYATEAVTVLQWSRLSDHIGRKPVLLLGLLGTVVSTILFGLSHSLWALVLRYGRRIKWPIVTNSLLSNDSRCLNGMLNGNVGVIKSMIAELTDETNVARGFSLMPMARAVGYIIGSVGRVLLCHLVTDVLGSRVL